ncbi:FAD-dependent monooxygenase [Kurthia senegalensis]|uniref:FAD-dependent monooxygenase n=2 Tax=Kurthia senegalensis TaxID=1033740 RepID=UPI000289D9AB
MKRMTDVCIVGAGPAGAMLAFLLVRKGLDVTLLESSKTLGKAFRGEHINEHGEALLKRYGLFGNLDDSMMLPMKKLENWKDGICYETIKPDPAIGHLGIHVPQRHLLAAILKPIQHNPNFHLCVETKMIRLEGQTVYARHEGVEVAIESKLVVGADGRYSTVRKCANIGYKTWTHGYDLLWARIEKPKDWEPMIHMALVDGKQLALFTQAENRIQIGWNIDKGSFPSLRKTDFSQFIQRLIDAFPVLETQIHQSIQSWKDFVLLDVHSSYADVWGRDGVVLLGDAAHTMAPTGAFGLNSALIDAEYLATLLEEDGSIDNEAIAQFERQRADRIHALQKQQLEEEQHFALQFEV